MERWRKVEGWPYSVSDQGRVRNDRTGYILKPMMRGGCKTSRYPHVSLCNGVEVSFAIHALVLTAFRGPCPEGMQGCHKDGSRDNNQLSNLRWGTPKENMADRDKHGRTYRGMRHHSSRLTEQEVVAMRTIRERYGWPFYKLAEAFGVSTSTAHHAARGDTWRHL